MSVTHAFVNPKTDSVDTTITRPSDWNAEHVDNLGLVNVKDTAYGAAGNGVANDGPEINAALTAAATGFMVLPNAQYLVSALTSAPFSKINGYGSRLLPSGNSMTVLTLATAGHSLQANDYLLVRDLRIDGTGKTGITGIATDGGVAPGTSLAHGILENIMVTAVDGYSFNLGNAQFLRTYNLRAANGAGVGMLIANDTTSGGGNSNDHYSLHVTGKTVGVVVNGTRFTTPAEPNVFWDPSILDNTVCGMAFFTAFADIHGGAPEYNADGAATATVDGQTVKRSSMYLNDSSVRLHGMYIAEATANPVFLIENGSTLVLANVSGYGLTTGHLVQADSTSIVHLVGFFACNGLVQNVGSWPDGFGLPGGQTVLYGDPVHSVDPTLPAVYAHPAPALVAGGSNPPAVSYVEDADLGYCRQAVFTANVGSTGSNLVGINIAAGASMDSVFSVLLKSATDTEIAINLHDGASYNIISMDAILLKADKVTRLVFAKSGIAAGTWFMQWWPAGTDAPTVKFSNLQLYQGAAGVATTTREIAKIVKYGAFNPGPIRATTTNLELQSALVNTAGKYPGKQVWNSTTNRVVFAVGRAVGDVWKDGVNATVHTPV